MKNKILNVLKYLYLIITIILSINLIRVIYSLNILPNKYLIIIISIITILNIINIILTLIKKIWPKIIAILIGIILIFISIIGTIYINETKEFLNNSFNNNTKEITTYNYIVLKDRYNNMDELTNKKIGYFVSEKDKEEIINNIDSYKINKKEYLDLFELYKDLINKKIDVILLDSAYLDILSEDNKDIYENIKIINEFNIETIISSNVDKVKEIKPINIYISGSDSRSKTIYNKSRSDVNMILTINPYSKDILITCIPRDYYVKVHNQTGLKDKLTHAGIYGLDISEKTVEDLFDIEIDYSVKINFNAVTEIVDLVGGIDIYSDITFNSYHKKGWVVKKGWNHMDGAKALAYSRERYAYASGDRHRIQNQGQVLEAVLKKIMTNKKLLLQYDELLSSLSNLYRTTIPKEVVTLYVKEQLKNMATWNFNTIRVNGSNASLPTYTAPNSKRYVMIPYEENIIYVHDEINKVLSKK